MSVRVQVFGDGDVHAELLSLRSWLSQDEELRGRVEVSEPELAPGQMGGLADALVVAVGSGGVLTVLAQQVQVWLKQHRSSVEVRISEDADSRTVTISADHLDDPRGLVRDVLGEASRER